MEWRQIFIREVREIFGRDKRRASFLFGASIAYLIIFGMLYGPHVVQNVPLVLYDENQTQLSRSLVQAFADSERFEIIGQASDQKELEQLLYSQTAYAAVHIPYDFSQNVAQGRASPVLLSVNGANLVITNAATTAAQEILMTFSQEASARLASAAGVPLGLAYNKTTPLTLAVRVMHNPTLSYLNFFVIGLAMAAFQQGIFLAVGASIIGDYTREKKLLSARPFQVMTAKLLPYFLFGTVSFLLTLLTAFAVFDIPCKGDIGSLLLLSTAFTITAIGLSSLVASCCDSEITFTKISLSYSVPAFTLSGYLWPVISMDAFSQVIAHTFPVFYLSDAVRDIMLAGYSPLLYQNVGVLLAMGLTLTGLASVVYARKRRMLQTQRLFDKPQEVV